MKKYFKNVSFCIGLTIVLLLVAILITSFISTPFDPLEMDSKNTFATPNSTNLLGTDNFGRDIYSRVLEGSKITFFIGGCAVVFGLVIGGILGAVSGYFGGVIDVIIMRIVDAMMAFPGVILALVFITVFERSVFNISIALGIMAVPRFCRVVRSEFLQIMELDYIKACRCKGCSNFRIIFIHILPNTLSSLIVTISLSFSSAVMAESGLSYLGLGVQPPYPSWGKMLQESQAFFLTNPYYAIIPGAMITLIVLGFNLLGDGIQDVNKGR